MSPAPCPQPPASDVNVCRDRHLLAQPVRRLQECPKASCKSRKLITFFATVSKLYRTEWIVKVDDSIYLNPQRLTLAFPQWHAMQAEYIGCMKHGVIIPVLDIYSRGAMFERDFMLMGHDYPLNAGAAAVVVSAAAVEGLLAPNAHQMRMLNSEGAPRHLLLLTPRCRQMSGTRDGNQRECERLGSLALCLMLLLAGARAIRGLSFTTRLAASLHACSELEAQLGHEPRSVEN